MKTAIKFSIALALCCACAVPASAQINLNALKNKAANAAKNAAMNAVNKAVDATVDKVVNGNSNKGTSNNSQAVDERAQEQVQSQTEMTAVTSLPAEETDSAASAENEAINEALNKYLSYKSRIVSAIENADLDFLLSDTFREEIPSLVETIRSSNDYEIRRKADGWTQYYDRATEAIHNLTNKAPQSSQFLPRLKYYLDNAEASATDASKAFWLDRAMSSCKYLGSVEFMLNNTSELRSCWNRARTMYAALDSRYKRKDAEYRNDMLYPEKIIELQSDLPDFDKQYAETKADVEKRKAERAKAAASNTTRTSSSTSKPTTSNSSSNTVKVKEVKSTGKDTYDIIGTNNNKIGSIKRVTSSDSYYIYDKSNSVVGECRKNQGSSGYTIYKRSSRVGETSNFTQAAKWVLD